MKPIYQIQEYGSFITGKDIDGYVTLPERTFEQLENFILSNRSKDTDALELMGLSARKGVGKVITAKNYAGEVAEYMMILSLNELGKAFLNVDKFVSQNQPYASTRPNAE